MSINNLSEEELLALAQNTKALDKDIYNSGVSSVCNYVRLNKFKIGNIDEVAFRIPLDLAYIHYKDWFATNYPHIIVDSLALFSREIRDYINHVRVKRLYYLLIRNCAQFRTYTDHWYNQYLKDRVRKKNALCKRKSYKSRRRN